MPPYIEPGYTATDVEDGDLTSQVSVAFFKNDGGNLVSVPSIDTTEIGGYQVNYSVVDSQNNTTVESRIVNVVAPAQSSRSVIFDIADNWGHSSILSIRSIEFKLNGVLIPSAGFTTHGTTQFNSGYSPIHAFTVPLKTGEERGWLAASGVVQNQRLQVVFSSTLQFDEIVINNQHSSGSFTNLGARNIVITGSTDVITDTTYGAPIANSTELFDGELAQHTPSDVVDDQVIWTA